MDFIVAIWISVTSMFNKPVAKPKPPEVLGVGPTVTPVPLITRYQIPTPPPAYIWITITPRPVERTSKVEEVPTVASDIKVEELEKKVAELEKKVEENKPTQAPPRPTQKPCVAGPIVRADGRVSGMKICPNQNRPTNSDTDREPNMSE